MWELIRKIWKEIHKSEVRILTGLSTVLIALTVVAFFANKYSQRSAASTAEVEKAQEIKFDIQEILSVSTDLETGARGYVITGNEKYLEPANKAIGIIFKDLDNLKTLLADNKIQLKRISDLENLIDKKISHSTRAIEVRRDKGLSEAILFVSSGGGRELMDDIREVSSRMMEEEDLFLKTKGEQNRKNMKDFDLTFNLLLIKIAISIITVLVVLRYYFKRRRTSEHELTESKQQLQSIIDNTSSVIFIKDLEGRYIMINRQFEELFHSRKQEAKGKTDYELFSSEVANAIRKSDLEVMTSKKLMQFEEDIPNYGEVRHYISVKFPLFDKNHEIYGICGNATDITELRRSKLDLEKNKNLLQGIIDGNSPVISVKDIHGKYLMINRQFERMFGVKREEVKGKTDAEIFPKEVADVIHKADAEVISGKKQVQLKEEMLTSAGEKHQYFSIKIPLFDSHNNVYAVCSNTTDITEISRIEKHRSKEISDLFNNAPCGYMSTDKNGIVVEMNDTELKWLGYTREEVIGKMPTQDLLSEDSTHIFTFYFPRLRSGETKTLHDLEIRFKRKDGTIFPALVNTIGVYDANGNFERTRTSVFDITIMKKAESLFIQN